MARLPALDGSLYLPDVIDFHLKQNPTTPAYVFVQEEAHTVQLTFEQVARAVHRGAYLLRPERDGKDGTVVGIIANIDVLLYQTIVLACIRAGFVPFLISPRNSAAAIDEMLVTVSCTTILRIAAHSTESAIIDSLSIPDLNITELPSLEALYGPDLHSMAVNFKCYPKPDTPIDSHSTAFIIHSSGSTGFPKPVPQSFLTALHWMTFLNVSGMEDPTIKICAAMAIPSFHAFGVNFQLLYPLTLAKPAALFPPTSFNFITGKAASDASPIFPQPAAVLRHVQLSRSDVLLSVPSLLTVWRSNPADVEVLKSLKAVCCSSGPLPHGVGDELVRQGVPLCTSYGATEFGIPTYRLPLDQNGQPTVELDKNSPERVDDWIYLAFNDLTQLRLIPTGGHDTFELQILTCDTHQPAIENLPDVKGYATCDVIQAHPSKKGLWRIVGRTDDVIVLSAGEKVVPNAVEDIIGSSPDIAGVIMFGRGRPHCGLLIEPRDPAGWQGKTTELIDTLWPLIEQANRSSPAFSRVVRDMILVTSIDKPFERAAKGSPARQATLNLYEFEIDNMYEAFESGRHVEPPKSWMTGDIEAWLRVRVNTFTAQRKAQIDANEDLFELGIDSISAASLRGQILGALPHEASSKISHTFVYDNPTLSGMARSLASIVSGNVVGFDIKGERGSLENMIAKYSTFAVLNMDKAVSPDRVVLLSGSTGSLGSYILEALLQETCITKIYALNRQSNSSSLERQKLSFRSKGLDEALLESGKVIWLDGDIAEFSEQVKGDITVVIHNAWKLDFNLALASFETLISATHALINIARTAKHEVKFIFTSSVSVAQNWNNKLGPVPEQILDTVHSFGKGYGESKCVADKMLEESELDFTSLRIGQIVGGAPLGVWATSDWVPAMVRTSVEIGALPAAVGNVSWIPMPAVARAALDAVICPTKEPVLNLVHPHAVPWDSLMQDLSASMTAHCVTKTILSIIPFGEWMKRVEELEEQDVGVQAKAPALKLLAYFIQFAGADAQLRLRGIEIPDTEAGGRPVFTTTRARAVSRAVRQLEASPLSREDVDLWVSYWKGTGFFAAE